MTQYNPLGEINLKAQLPKERDTQREFERAD